MANRLEEKIDELESEIELPKAFIIPGGNMASSYLDLARAMVRREEDF